MPPKSQCFEKTEQDDRKMFVGGLPQEVDHAELKEYFENYGEVDFVNLLPDKTGGHRGFGFIVFKEEESMEKAIKEGDHKLKCKLLTVKRAGDKPGKIFVGRIPESVSMEEIEAYFEKYGKVTDVNRPVSKDNNEPKDFCFVTFEKSSVAKELVAEGRCSIKGNGMKIKAATTLTQRDYGDDQSGRGGKRGGYVNRRDGSGDQGGFGGQFQDFDNGGGYGGGNYGGGMGGMNGGGMMGGMNGGGMGMGGMNGGGMAMGGMYGGGMAMGGMYGGGGMGMGGMNGGGGMGMGMNGGGGMGGMNGGAGMGMGGMNGGGMGMGGMNGGGMGMGGMNGGVGMGMGGMNGGGMGGGFGGGMDQMGGGFGGGKMRHGGRGRRYQY